jgi:transcriptional regulator with PAS, ATPase and Fis domain
VFILKDPADPDIRLSDLPAELVETLAGEPGSPGATGTLEDRLLAGERTILERALAEHDGNRTRAAESLGISRYALLRKLQKHRLA